MLFKFILMAVFCYNKIDMSTSKNFNGKERNVSTILILSPIVLVALASVAIILALKSRDKKMKPRRESCRVETEES
jgi:flagellar basal body-associated protein FliL